MHNFVPNAGPSEERVGWEPEPFPLLHHRPKRRPGSRLVFDLDHPAAPFDAIDSSAQVFAGAATMDTFALAVPDAVALPEEGKKKAHGEPACLGRPWHRLCAGMDRGLAEPGVQPASFGICLSTNCRNRRLRALHLVLRRSMSDFDRLLCIISLGWLLGAHARRGEAQRWPSRPDLRPPLQEPVLGHTKDRASCILAMRGAFSRLLHNLRNLSRCAGRFYSPSAIALYR